MCDLEEDHKMKIKWLKQPFLIIDFWQHSVSKYCLLVYPTSDDSFEVGPATTPIKKKFNREWHPPKQTTKHGSIRWPRYQRSRHLKRGPKNSRKLLSNVTIGIFRHNNGPGSIQAHWWWSIGKLTEFLSRSADEISWLRINHSCRLISDGSAHFQNARCVSPRHVAKILAFQTIF